jgi:hypothetical protein
VRAIGSVLCLLFVLATGHMILSLLQLFLYVLTAPQMSKPFVYYKGGAAYLTQVSKGLWVAIMVVADSLVVSTLIRPFSFTLGSNYINYRYGVVGCFGIENLGSFLHLFYWRYPWLVRLTIT